jgi:hypothetical protein
LSFSVYSLRKYAGDARQKIQDTINKFKEKQTQQTSTEPGEEETSQTIGAIGISYLKYYDTNLQFAKTVVAQSGYCQPCLEPDANLLKVWLPMQKVKHEMLDQSGIRNPVNHARFRGIPRISQGIDIAGAQTTELVFDGSSNYIEIIDDPSDETNLPNTNIQFSAVTTGFGFCIRIKPYEVTRTGWNLPILYKFDYTSNNWIWAFIDGVTSKLTVYVKKAGVFYSTIYNTALVANNRYEITFAFDAATPANRKLYVNGTNVTTLNSPTEPLIPWSDNLSMYLGFSYPLVDALPGSKYPTKDVSKLFYGTMQDFRWWKEKVPTATEASALFTNKVTFYNLAARTPLVPNTSFVRT